MERVHSYICLVRFLPSLPGLLFAVELRVCTLPLLLSGTFFSLLEYIRADEKPFVPRTTKT